MESIEIYLNIVFDNKYVCLFSAELGTRGLVCVEVWERFILQKRGSFSRVSVRGVKIMIRVERETNKNAHIRLTDI
jgi:hypothetical protein